MKRTIKFLALLWLAVTTVHAQLVSPESIVYYPAANSYFISCYGNNSIAVMDSTGEIRTWATGLPSPAGITIVGDTLFCNSTTQIRVYCIPDSVAIDTIFVNGAGYLNDITSDGEYLYVSDSQIGRVLRVDIATGEWNILASNGFSRVNGVWYDAGNNRLITCAMPQNAPIMQIALPGGEVETLYTTSFSVLDGITMDSAGFVYVSSHRVAGVGGDNNIYRFDPEFINEPELVGGGYNQPADIFYNVYDNRLAIPVFGSHTIAFLDFSGNGSHTLPLVPNEFEMGGVYPNPFNGNASVNITLPSAAFIQLKLYDVLGRQLEQPVSSFFTAGNHSMSFSLNSAASGMYFVEVSLPGSMSQTRRAVYQK